MRALRVVAVCVLLFAAANVHAANELRVDRQRIRVDESVQITVRLEGDLADVESIQLPLDNLVLDGPPNVSAQFRWINGATSSERTFTYSAHPKTAGKAVVGPVRIADGRGPQVTLPAVEIAVVDSPPVVATAPEEALNELERDQREAVVVVAEAEPRQAWVGGQVVVTWYLYTAESIRRFSVTENPKLTDFWVEEMPLEDRRPVELRVQGRTIHRVPIRRAALYPLRAGTLQVPPLSIVVEVMRPLEDVFGTFRFFEGRVVDVRRKSRPIPIAVAGLPVETDVVGKFQFQCGTPFVPGDGPVRIDVTLTGDGNLRTASPPAFTTAFAGSVETQDLGVTINRELERAEMSRKWRLLVFPSREGELAMPPLRMTTFDPYAQREQVLQCGGWKVAVERSKTPAAVAAQESAPAPRRVLSPRIVVAGASVAVLIIGLWSLGVMWSHMRTDRGTLRRFLAMRDDIPALRRAIQELVSKKGWNPRDLFYDYGDVGDRYRALHSLLDLIEKEPSGGHSEKELKRRLGEFLRALG